MQVSTPAAGVAEIHEMAMDGDVMRMRAIGALELPAGKTVALQPGGYHLMLMQLKAALKAGETVPLTLVVETRDGKRQTLDVSAAVRPLNTAAARSTDTAQARRSARQRLQRLLDAVADAGVRRAGSSAPRHASRSL